MWEVSKKSISKKGSVDRLPRKGLPKERLPHKVLRNKMVSWQGSRLTRFCREDPHGRLRRAAGLEQQGPDWDRGSEIHRENRSHLLQQYIQYFHTKHVLINNIKKGSLGHR